MEKVEKINPNAEILWTKNLVWMLIIQAITALVYHGFSTLIPFIQSEFMLSKVEVGYMTSALFIGSSLLAVPGGIITDKIGVRNTLTLFCFISVISLFLYLFTTSYMAVIILLVFLGFGYGAIAPATNRGIMEEFSAHKRGTAMGIKQMGVPLGVVLASILFPIFTQLLTWRISLFIIGFLLLIIILSYFYAYRNYSVLKPTHLSLNQLKNVLLNAKIIQVACVIAFFIAMQVSVTTFLVIYLYQSLSYSLAFSTFCFSLLFCGGMVGRAVWGFISDTFFNSKRKVVLIIIGLLSAISLFLFGTIDRSTPYLITSILAFILGISANGWNGISIIMIAEKADNETVGLTSGYGLTISNIGAIGGAPLSGLIIDLTGSYQFMWCTLGGFIIFISIITLFLKLD